MAAGTVVINWPARLVSLFDKAAINVSYWPRKYEAIVLANSRLFSLVLRIYCSACCGLAVEYLSSLLRGCAGVLLSTGVVVYISLCPFFLNVLPSPKGVRKPELAKRSTSRM